MAENDIYKRNRQLTSEEDTNYTVVNKMSFDRHINIYDEESEFSVFNLLPANSTFLRDSIRKVPELYRNMDHYELRAMINPTPTLNQLRINFWSEYDRCLDVNAGRRRMQTNNIVAGVCSISVFKDHMRNPDKMAWLLTPVQSYQMGVQDVLETCLYKMRVGLEKLNMDTVKDMNTIMKIYEAFDKRVHGEYTQNIKKEVQYKGAVSPESVQDKMKKLGIQNNTVVVYNDSNESEK